VIKTLTGCTDQTITDWMGFCKEVVGEDLEELDEVDRKIGGHGIIVEIDESKLGKRKYNRGHRIEGQWVVGGIERTAEKKIFFCAVQTRDADTLLEIITENVHVGSVIHTDCWRGYSTAALEAAGYTHTTVNHEHHFVDPITGVHTNTIEGLWNEMKRNMSPRRFKRNTLLDDGFEFMWRRRYSANLWERMLIAITNIRYVENDEDNDE
jgi:transposase-like protein